MVDKFHGWLSDTDKKALPKSSLGKAISYCLNQWKHLTTFLNDGNVELSNNRAQRAAKSFSIGRKNHLFSKTPNGARSSAICYSIVETTKANGLSPFHYLNYLFEAIPNLDPGDRAAIDKRLPWSKSIPAACHTPSKT